MKNNFRSIFFFATLALLFTTRATPIEPESCFLAPTGGLAWDGSALWVATDDRLYQFAADGELLKDIPSPVYRLQDLAFDGQYLWGTSYERIYKINPQTGVSLGSIAPYPGYLPSFVGLTWGDNALWASEFYFAEIFKISPTGAIMGSFPAPAGNFVWYGSGLAWLDRHLWFSPYIESPFGFYEVDPSSGQVLQFIEYTDAGKGLAADDSHLWNSSLYDDKICRFEIVPPQWPDAYAILFANSRDLDAFRTYRDQVLRADPKGKLYTYLLYAFSEDALQVLLEHPELLASARSIIDNNRAAVARALKGEGGALHDTRNLLSFFDAYETEAPPRLRLLTNLIRNELNRARANGQLFLGFELPSE